jgi:hypothetical protein
MFVRKNKNRSGSVSVQIIEKRHGTYRVFRTVGTSADPDEIERLSRAAKRQIACSPGQLKLFAAADPLDYAVDTFIDGLSNANIRTVGPELIFGTLFDRIGFNAIPEELFRHLVIARLAYPGSKLRTIDYLERYRGVRVSASAVYRFLDRLTAVHKERVEQTAYAYTKKRLRTITVAFYDLTTLYFESEEGDDLRKTGWSKDGKFDKPQIMIGLLLGQGGYPIGYDVFEGNTWEGDTLIPAMERFERKFRIGRPTVVADAGLLSNDNIEKLIARGYTFILGARIKNEPEDVKRRILETLAALKANTPTVLEKPDGIKLIVTYSEKRARKDARNRDKGIAKLKARIANGKLTKEQLTNRGYNKFLTIEGKATVTLNESKIESDQRWDGLKGYLTNTALSADDVVARYRDLWQIENAFRISKTDLKVRPVFHRVRRRIEAHLTVAFAAYTVYKELERLLRERQIPFSAKRAAELTHTMYGVSYQTSGTAERKQKILAMSEEQQSLYETIQ